MTKITAILEKDADPNLIRQIFENVKGVLNVTIQKEKIGKEKNEEAEEWIKKLHKLQNNIDKSAIDMNDERTRYIMRENQ